jgi:hypothetical protein
MSWGARVALVSVVFVHAGVATAAEPACFPERTVLATTAVQDAAGRVIGTIRGGKQVAVISDRIGPEGDRAEISVSEPIPLRGFVKRRNLLVFLREDFPLEPNRTWWTAGAPMLIFAGDTRRTEVTREDASADAEAPPVGAQRVALDCRRLRAKPTSRSAP